MPVATALSLLVMASIVAVSGWSAAAQRLKPDDFLPDMNQPVPPAHIIGNIYYVGARNIASYLITTPDGHILMDTGTTTMTNVIKNSVEKLGFKITDITPVHDGDHRYCAVYEVEADDLNKIMEELGTRFAGVAPESLASLVERPWRGNVRELENALEQAMVFGDTDLIRVPRLGPNPAAHATARLDLREAVRQFERQHVRDALADTGGDKREAARRLRISLASLYRKLTE